MTLSSKMMKLFSPIAFPTPSLSSIIFLKVSDNYRILVIFIMRHHFVEHYQV